METYQVATTNPVKAMEDLIISGALPAALSNLGDQIESGKKEISGKELLSNLGQLIGIGLDLMKKDGEDGKKNYELFYACGLAAFLNNNTYSYIVCFPEDSSYDFLLLKQKNGHEPDFVSRNGTKTIHINKTGTVLKVELFETLKTNDLEKTLRKKSLKDYRNRIILGIIKGYFDLTSKYLSDVIGPLVVNFSSCYLMSQVPNINSALTLTMLDLKNKMIALPKDIPISVDRIVHEFGLAFSRPRDNINA